MLKLGVPGFIFLPAASAEHPGAPLCSPSAMVLVVTNTPIERPEFAVWVKNRSVSKR